MHLVGLEGNHDSTAQWLTVGAERLRRLESEQARVALDVPLPATHRHAPAVAHEEAIARVDVGGWR